MQTSHFIQMHFGKALWHISSVGSVFLFLYQWDLLVRENSCKSFPSLLGFKSNWIVPEFWCRVTNKSTLNIWWNVCFKLPVVCFKHISHKCCPLKTNKRKKPEYLCIMIQNLKQLALLFNKSNFYLEGEKKNVFLNMKQCSASRVVLLHKKSHK